MLHIFTHCEILLFRGRTTILHEKPLQQVRGAKKVVRVVLIKDIPHLGAKGEEKVIALGFARDTLFPHKLAVLASPEALKAYEHERVSIDYEARNRALRLKKFVEKLKKIGEISIKRFKMQDGSPHSEINAAIISEKIYMYKGIKIEPARIRLDAPIRSFGAFSVSLDIDGVEPIKLPVAVVSRTAIKENVSEEGEE